MKHEHTAAKSTTSNQLTDVLLSIFSDNKEDKIIETRELREVRLQKQIQSKFLF